MNAFVTWLKRPNVWSVALLALVLLVILPASLDAFRIGLIGKYLCYAFVAVGLVMAWGYGGILSLGQGVFFGLGGYAMAMYLKLEASDPDHHQDPVDAGHPRLHGLEPDHRAAADVAALQEPAAHAHPRDRGADRCWPSSSASRCSSGASAACTSPSSRRPSR